MKEAATSKQYVIWAATRLCLMCLRSHAIGAILATGFW